MVLDIRARVESNLGPVISASISDDYIQGNGLIKTSGSCVVKGLIAPPVGTSVVFYYTKRGITRRIPRALRVLSSFADPFRKTTSIQLGCKLTYLQDLTDPINWTAFDDPANTDFTEESTKVVIVPISAQSVAQKCLAELGLTASGLSLTNYFSIEKFDFSPGYVQILGDLLVSECYCGWLDEREVLQIVNLSELGATGPIIFESDIIDVGEIGVGQIPGDAVVVTYSTLKLKIPTQEEGSEDEPTDTISDGDTADLFSGWEQDETSQRGPGILVSYKRKAEVDSQTDDNPAPLRFMSYSNNSYSKVLTEYTLISVLKSDLNPEYSLSGGIKITDPVTGKSRGPRREDYEKKSVVSKRTTYEGRAFAEIAGGWITEALSIDVIPSNWTEETTTVETYSYDSIGNETERELVKYGDAVHLMGAAGVNYVYYRYVAGEFDGYEIIDLPRGYQTGALPANMIYLEYTKTQTIYLADHTKQITERWAPWHETISGQQTIAAVNESLEKKSEAELLLERVILSGLRLLDVTVNTRSNRPQAQSRPSDTQIVQAGLIDESSTPGEEYSTESKSEIALATGNPGAQLRIEFSMPYAPDDRFYVVSPGTYAAYSSNAQQKAKQFGLIQNKLLLGNRSGMNIQTAPEKLPLQPFSPFFIYSAGVAILYRTNATSWTVDNSGIIVSTDALYWGVAGAAP